MEDLVLIMDNKAVCTSLQVAEKFGKRHDRVLRAIDDLKIYSPQNWGKSFREDTYKDSTGKRNKMYYMNRDGFTIVAMGFTGKNAIEWKWKYINAFNTMEEMLKERNTQLWIEQRTHGKLIRNKETDVIKQLTDYAKEQGSTHADRLYMVYTKLAKSVISGKRDKLTVKEINNLTLVENVILQTIQIDMSMGIHYKDIYKDCKDRIQRLVDIAYLTA